MKLISSRPCIAYNTITYRLYDIGRGFMASALYQSVKDVALTTTILKLKASHLIERPSAYEGGPGKALLIAGCNVLQAKLEHVLYEDYNVEEYDNCFV